MTTKDAPVTLDFCIEAMRGSMNLRGQAVRIELAVGLVVYRACGSADAAAKKVLRGIHASAGRADCLTPQSPSYKPVMRRIDRCASLYDKLKSRTIKKWIDGKSEQAAIDAIVAELKALDIQSMEDVLDYVGLPRSDSKERSQPEHNRRASDREAAYTVDTEHVHITIPSEATPEELVQAADKLMELAREMRMVAA